MRKFLALALAVSVLSAGQLLWGQAEANITVTFVPNYPPVEGNITVNFTPNYPPLEGNITVNFTPSYPPLEGNITVNFIPNYPPVEGNITVTFTPNYPPLEGNITVTFTPSYPSVSQEQINGQPVVSLSASGINIESVATPTSDVTQAIRNIDKVLIGSMFNLTPSGTVFDPPATLTFRYDFTDPNIADENQLQIYRYNGTNWVAIANQTVDVANDLITAPITSLSLYAILGPRDQEPPSVTIFEPREGGAISQPEVVDISFDGSSRLYSATSSGEIIARDVSSHRILLRGNVSGTPTALFFSTHTQRLFVAAKNPNAVISLEPTSLSVLSSLSLDAFIPKQMVSDSSGQRLFVIGENSSEILEVSGSFQSVSQRTSLAGIPRAIVSRPPASEIFVLFAGEIALFSENNLFSKKSFIALPDPTGLAEDVSASRIYVSNRTDPANTGGSLWVLDSNNLSPVATLVSFDRPTFLLGAASKRLYVSNEGTKELFVIQPDNLSPLPFGQKTDITQIVPGKRAPGLLAKIPSPQAFAFGKGLALASNVPRILNESTAQSLPGETDRFYIASKDNLIFFEDNATLITPNSLSRASFFVKDNMDLLPKVSATLKNHTKNITRTIQKDEEVNPLNLEDGTWTLVVEATDASGNKTVQESGVFETIRDIQPPRTTASVGSPNFSQAPTFVSSETIFTLSSADDLLQAGDIQGLGVKEIRAALDSGAFVVFSATQTSFTLSALSPNVSEGAHTLRFLSEDLAGNAETEQTLSVFLDISSPDSSLTIASPSAMVSGEQFVSTQTTIGFSSQDKPTGGSGVNQIQFSISNLEFQNFTSAFTLAEGAHAISFFAEDNLAHRESLQVSTVSADGTAPTTTLTISGPSHPGEPTLVSTQAQFSLSAIDPVSNGVASGVDETRFRTDPNQGFQTYFIPFSLSAPDGIKTIEFFSKDKVQNQPPTPNLQSFELDTTAPQISLTNPSLSNQGVCRVIKGNVSVVGTIFDSHIQSWALEVAPFQDAQFGFTMISSGTTNASKPSLLAMWDTNSLSGHVTLRLTATDLVGNTSSTQVSLFVGDPELSLSISGGLLNKPSGIVVDSSGNIFVSDTNNNKIRKFSSSGALLQTIESNFNKPKGLALDSSGNIYICDTNNNRIVKLNTNGIFLTSFGKKGQGPGEFNKPTSIALDQKGNMYIADRNNGRIQKLDSQGRFLLDFVAASMSPTFGEDEDDFDEIDSAPFGVALDSNENIYASNEKRDEIVIFSPLGMLLKTIGQEGEAIGEFKKPQGISIFQDYLYVADRNNERVQKFDTFQLPVLTFGSKEQDEQAPTFMEKPTALAIDSQGNLYLTDRNEDTVKVFRFPTGQPPILVVLEKEKEKPKEEAKKPEEKKKEDKDEKGKDEKKDGDDEKPENAVAPSTPSVTSDSSSAVESSSATAPSQPAQTAPSEPQMNAPPSSPEAPPETPAQTASSTTAPAPQEPQSPATQTEAPPSQQPANENAPSQAPPDTQEPPPAPTEPASPASSPQPETAPSSPPAPQESTPSPSPQPETASSPPEEPPPQTSSQTADEKDEKKKEPAPTPAPSEDDEDEKEKTDKPKEDPDSALHLTDGDVKITLESPKPGQKITFHIEPGGAEMIELIVSDEKGNTIHQQTTGPAPLEGNRRKVNLHWDTPKDLPEGQYLYLIRAHKGSETQKILRTLTFSK